MAKINSEHAMHPIVKRDTAWLMDRIKVIEYTAIGVSTVRAPIIIFSKSLARAAILFFATVFRNSLISKMLADTTDIMVRQGMRMLETEVRGLIKDNPTKANGTGI